MRIVARRPTSLPLLAVAMVMGAVAHGYNMYSYPLYVTDEGIYIQQAWSILRQGRLSPYTYFYDHAPAGWILIAAWMQLLPLQFQTFGTAINTGRTLMLLAHVASVALLYIVTLRLSGSRLAAFLTTIFFNLSPLALFYQRQVLLDNLMVFWMLVSLYLGTRGDGRVVTPMMSGVAFGLAVLTKENAIFFGPVIAYLIYKQAIGLRNRRFVLAYFLFAGASTISLYFLYATLKNELLPSGLSFNLNEQPADHVSLLYTIWWQLSRNQGGIMNPESLFWEFSLRRWLPKDTFILAAGGIATLVNLGLGFRERKTNSGPLVAGMLAATYSFYLARGSMMLEFYVVPLLPFLAMNVGMVVARLHRHVPRLAGHAAVAALIGVLLLHPYWGYVLVVDEFGKVVPQDLYKLPLTSVQLLQLAWVRKNVPPDAKIVMDEDIWADLHDVRPFYKWAHSHWKAAADPDVRDRLFAKNWRNIDYLVMSNKMEIAMDQNNADGSEDWILTALRNSDQVWNAKRGDIELSVYRVRK